MSKSRPVVAIFSRGLINDPSEATKFSSMANLSIYENGMIVFSSTSRSTPSMPLTIPNTSMTPFPTSKRGSLLTGGSVGITVASASLKFMLKLLASIEPKFSIKIEPELAPSLMRITNSVAVTTYCTRSSLSS